jgi:hypothetical protein
MMEIVWDGSEGEFSISCFRWSIRKRLPSGIPSRPKSLPKTSRCGALTRCPSSSSITAAGRARATTRVPENIHVRICRVPTQILICERKIRMKSKVDYKNMLKCAYCKNPRKGKKTLTFGTNKADYVFRKCIRNQIKNDVRKTFILNC